MRAQIIWLTAVVSLYFSSSVYAQQSVWIDMDRTLLTERALDLQTALSVAEVHAIEVEDLRQRLQLASTPKQIDTAYSQVLDALISRFSLGQVPASVDPLWRFEQRSIDLQQRRAELLTAPSLLSALLRLLPQHSDYLQLLSQYAALGALGSDEPAKVKFSRYFRPGDMDRDIALIRDRLDWLGYPAKDSVSALAPRLFDEGLAMQIRAFQNDHGLDPDAIVGPDTLSWLNLSAVERRELLGAVLERWRWLPRELGGEYLFVSIPGFEVRHYKDEQLVGQFISISGRPSRPTPSFTAQLQQFVVNPSWTVPQSILIKDLVPKILAEPDYLEQQQMQVQRFTGGEWTSVDDSSINWAGLGLNDRDVRLVQAPGELNALGQIKFHMPNDYAIYLHDTPGKSLFKEVGRALSSGCVRVRGVIDLATSLMYEQGGQLQKNLAQSETKWLKLPRSVPVYLVYNRAWVADNGRLQMREDIYQADRELIARLDLKLKNAQLAAR